MALDTSQFDPKLVEKYAKMAKENPAKYYETLAQASPWLWAWYYKLRLSSGEFRVQGHEYQIGIMQCRSQVKVDVKSPQMTFTESEVIATLHGMIHGDYPKGVLYLFPTDDDVGEFSKARFAPLIEYNPQVIGKYVRSTDSTNLKRIGKAYLYLHGARATQKVQGKKESGKLRSRSVDKVVFDEYDLMDPEMAKMALDRFQHSEVQHEVYISTPTIPGWGIDRKYQESDQRVWMIRCKKCGADTCLELEFPDCLVETSDGKVIRACRKCREEILPKDGDWMPREKSDVAGFWISHLNSIYVNPKKILDEFRLGENLQLFYNSRLGMAYIAAEDRLTVADVLSCCSRDAMRVSHPGPCAMGVDVGKLLNVVVAFKPEEKRTEIAYIARVSSFNDIHDIAERFNVQAAVIDAEPETRKARDFADSEPYGVWLCDYQATLLTDALWQDDKHLVRVNRTQACDASHALVTSKLLGLPRRNDEIDLFAKQVCSPAKVLEEDPDGSRHYVYKATGGADHYRHALNYAQLALRHVGCSRPETPEERIMAMIRSRGEQQSYHPLFFGLEEAR